MLKLVCLVKIGGERTYECLMKHSELFVISYVLIFRGRTGMMLADMVGDTCRFLLCYGLELPT